MLSCDIIIFVREASDVPIWDGNIKDTTNFVTDKYLQINSCGFQNVQANYTLMRKKGRRDYHILLINDGECRALHNGKSYTLQRGNLVIYAPFEEQMQFYKAEASTLWCHFSGSITKELFASCNITSGVYFIKPSEAVFTSFSTLIQRFHQPNHRGIANSSLLELIYNISSAITDSEQKDYSDIIAPILTYINANYNKQLSLDELALKSGYSKSRFSHIFSEVTGTTPIKYQNNIRLKNSCEMLTSTSLTIAEIAYSCGFSDPLYFSRIFKKAYGVSPSMYRESYYK